MLAKAVPDVGRLFMGGGNPKISDFKPAQRGLSLRFDPGGGKSTDLVMISTPMFFATTPAECWASLQGRVPGPDGRSPAYVGVSVRRSS